MLKKIIFFIIFISNVSYSQLSNKHWLPPLHSRLNEVVQDHYVYLSTPEVTPFQVTIKNGGGSILTNIEIFDVYTGIGIDLDKKSMAYSLTFSDNKKTLTDEEVNSSMEKIIDTVSKKCGAELRK